MLSSFHVDAVILFKENNFVKAQEIFIQAIQEDPKVAENYFYLSQCYFFSNQQQQAVILLKKFIELNSSNDPTNVAYAFSLLGQCYEIKGDDTAALKCYETATKIYPSCAVAWHNLSLLYIKTAQRYLDINLANSMKFFDDAEVFIKKALVICSKNPILLHTLAGWYEKYIEIIRRSDLNDDSIQKNITNNFCNAIQYYQQALVLCKEQDLSLKNIVLINLVQSLTEYGHHQYHNKNTKAAEDLYMQAIHLDSERLKAISQMGGALFEQKAFFDSKTYFANLLKQIDDKQNIAAAWVNITGNYKLETAWEKAKKALHEIKQFSFEYPPVTAVEKELTEAKRATFFSSKPPKLSNETIPRNKDFAKNA